MNAKYMSALAISAALAIGTVGCGTSGEVDTGTEEVDPAAEEAAPVDEAADPCAATEDPCAADPCAAE